MRALITFLIISSISTLSAQNQCLLTVGGKITDSHDSEGLSFASIYMIETKQFAFTDDQGMWKIENVCPGNFHLKIDHLGCESKSIYIQITKDTTVNIHLEHHVELLSVVDVNDRRLSNSATKASYEVTGKYLAKYKSQNLAEIAKLIPGVDVIKSGSNVGKPTIHGLSGNRVSIVSDGIVVEGQQWGMDHSPEIDVSNSGSIKVIKGSAPILYGSMATAGVIISESEIIKSQDPHLHGKMRYNFQSNGLGHHIALQLYKNHNNWNHYLGTASKRSGDLKTPNYFLRNTGLSEQSLDYIAQKINTKSSLKYTFKLYRFNAGILRSAHIGNLTDLRAAISRDIPFFTEDYFTYKIAAPRQLVNHATGNIQFQKEVNSQRNYMLKYTFQLNNRKEFDIRRANRTGTPIVNMLLTNNLLEALYEYKPNSNLKYLLGTSLRFNINYNLPGTGASSLLPDYRLYNPNIFGLVTQKIGAKTQLEGGLRYEYHSYSVDRWIDRKFDQFNNNFQSINTNVGIGSEITDAISIKVDFSYVSRPPQINELYSKGLHQGLAAYEEGNAALTNENSIKSVADLSLDMHKFGHVNISLFAHHIDNFIYLIPRSEPILTVRGAFFAYDYTNSNTWLRGIDAIYKVNLAHSTEILLSGSITRSFNRDTKEEIIWTPPPTLRSQLSHDFYVAKNKTREINFSFGLDHVFENKFVSIKDDLLPPPPSFTIFNTDLTFKDKIARRPIQITLACRNLFNTQYRNYLNRFRYFADEPGRSIDITLLYNF